MKRKPHKFFKKILWSRFLINVKIGNLRVVQNSFHRIFLNFVCDFFAISKKNWKNKKWGSPGLFACKSLREFNNSHACLHALQNVNFKRLIFTHAQFGLPLNLTRTRAGTYHRCLPSLRWVHRLHRRGFSQQLRFSLFYITCGPIFDDFVTLSGLINHVFVEKQRAKECNWLNCLHNTCRDQLRGTAGNSSERAWYKQRWMGDCETWALSENIFYSSYYYDYLCKGF